MKVTIAGGGTGGHIYPGITIAKTLLEKVPDAKVIFIGTERGLEADIVPKEGFELAFIDVAGFRRKLSLDTLKTAYRAARSVFQARAILKRFKPDVVVGTGGYVSGPVVLAAWLLRIPTMIHEQNALPGYTTKILSLLADAVAVTYPESAGYLPKRARTRVTGNPIRRSILETTKNQGLAAFGLDPRRLTILIFGGSQGARAINKAAVKMMPDLIRSKDVQVIYQTGKLDYERVIKELEDKCEDALLTSRLIVRDYIYRMDYAMACADLVVGRAGAISIAEITGRGLPAILIPLPSSAEGHQEKNAKALEAAGAAIVINQRDLNRESLLEAIIKVIDDGELRKHMAAQSKKLGRPGAARDLVDILLSLSKGQA